MTKLGTLSNDLIDTVSLGGPKVIWEAVPFPRFSSLPSLVLVGPPLLSCCHCSQVFVVSTLVSVTPAQPFIFRNYEYPANGLRDGSARQGHEYGSSKHEVRSQRGGRGEGARQGKQGLWERESRCRRRGH